jgi:Fic/DOC family
MGRGRRATLKTPSHSICAKIPFSFAPRALQRHRFLTWLNNDSADPAVIKAALAHLWFVTLHPFDDGNGRIARAIGDLLLARADGSPERFYLSTTPSV